MELRADLNPAARQVLDGVVGAAQAQPQPSPASRGGTMRMVNRVRRKPSEVCRVSAVPTAWLPGFDRERWDERGMCPQAYGALFQSNLSQVFIACASQAGAHGGLDFLGSSIVADPYGKLALGPLPGTKDEIAVVEIDMAAAALARVRSPLISPRADRRTDVYGIAVDGRVL
jgi:N-carbamoylputrescine amidase